MVPKSIYRLLNRTLLSPHNKTISQSLVSSTRSMSSSTKPSFSLSLSPTDTSINSHQTLFFHLDTALLVPSSTFPYFMLVAAEAGGFLKALFLLLLYPLIWFLGEDEEICIKIMTFVSFCGLRKDKFKVGRTVMPKHFLETVGMEGVNAMLNGLNSSYSDTRLKSERLTEDDSPYTTWKERVCVTSMPRVMVEEFVKEYLGVEVVVGREMKVVGGFYTGFMEDNKKKEEMVLKEVVGTSNIDCSGGFIGFIGSSCKNHQSLILSQCKEVFMVTEAQKRSWHGFSKEDYPKPLIFHDGRLAFLPTPLATLSMFIWLPFAFFFSIIRAIVCLTFPYKLSIPISAALGMRSRRVISRATKSVTTHDSAKNCLFVCNHRTLLDPIYISAGLGTDATAVTYSLSRVSEALSPIKTVRLSRERDEDKRRMDRYLKKGHLVVCPEGTTCREPFVLRFSPLFTELAHEVVPVALEAHVSMFYGTTAGGVKCLDPLFFLLNPFPTYEVEFLEKIEMLGTSRSRYEIANRVQKAIGDALGFKCTALTRKDKYLMLAGNDGMVADEKK